MCTFTCVSKNTAERDNGRLSDQCLNPVLTSLHPMSQAWATVFHRQYYYVAILNLFNSVECFFSSFNGRKLYLARGYKKLLASFYGDTKSFWPAFFNGYKKLLASFFRVLKASGQLFLGVQKVSGQLVLGVQNASGQLFIRGTKNCSPAFFRGTKSFWPPFF